MTRFGWVMATYFSAMATVGAAFVKPLPRLIWNASASTPIGLYAVRPPGALRDTELVAVMPPEPIASFFADGGYLPRGVPLMKHVLALPGTERLPAWAAHHHRSRRGRRCASPRPARTRSP